MPKKKRKSKKRSGIKTINETMPSSGLFKLRGRPGFFRLVKVKKSIANTQTKWPPYKRP